MSIVKVNTTQYAKLRLLLSTYQDGTGRDTKDRTLPGWEDFEDVVEIVFEGQRLKSKSVFDIIVPGQDSHTGISCKITKTLKQSSNTVLIEHSRVNAEFFNVMKDRQIKREDMFNRPQDCGDILLSLINNKHEASAKEGNIDLSKSFFLVMTYDVDSKLFKVFQFPFKMPRANKITWTFNESQKHLRGTIDGQLVFQWFHEGGGQLKYYPATRKALWSSDIFALEPLLNTKINNIKNKVEEYFKEHWNAL